MNEGFVKFNANPKGRKTGDCTTRAIACAACIKWEEALRLQYETALKTGWAVSSTQNTDKVLTGLGFESMKVSVARGEGRPTVAKLAEANPTCILVISVSSHLTCVRDGIIFDLWDTGYKSVYKYWRKEV